MTVKALKEVMQRLYQKDEESYNRLWESVRCLTNLGLLEDRIFDAMVQEDDRLFEEATQ